MADHILAMHRKSGALWSCRCDCGNNHAVYAYVLRRGDTTSCGCHRREVTRVQHTTHGMYKHPGYRAWIDTHRRCASTHHKMRKSYLDRGITVCARWATFEPFWEDMGPTWRKGLTLDRRNNDGHYTPDNCRWATRKEQSLNQRHPKTWSPARRAAQKLSTAL